MNIQEVIKKLRILADPERNDNVHQREAARRKAEELMAKHRITERDLGREGSKWEVHMEYNFEDMSPLLRMIFERMASDMKMHFDKTDIEKLIKQQNEARAGQAERREETTFRQRVIEKAFRDWFSGKEKEDD